MNRASGRDALAFAVTYDYRCPFARNVHEHLIAGLRAGAPWEVRFWPFSLLEIHVSPDEPGAWDAPGRRRDLLALEVGIEVRDRHPEAFLDVHEGLFAARHDRGLDLRDEDVLADVLERSGLPAGEVIAATRGGTARATLRREHEAAVSEHRVFGVPTIVYEGRAVFVRLMTRPEGDADAARATVERLVSLVRDHAEINELKHTSIPR